MIKYIGEKGRFGNFLAPGRKRKYWEIERDENVQALKVFDRQISKKNRDRKDKTAN